MRFVIVLFIMVLLIILASYFIYLMEEMYKDEQLKKELRKNGKCIFCGKDVPENVIVCDQCNHELENHSGENEGD